ncbi:MAG: GTPase HflX [Magnetococcales bacterium]|nr:GTPase HflX [Magnetococcales bacterium]
MFDTQQPKDHAVLVQPLLDDIDSEQGALLADELSHLAKTAGLVCSDTQLIRIQKISPSHFIGKGWVERLKDILEHHEAVVLVVNTALSPVQQRNLERGVNAKVVDRSGLILEIFAARARTKEGRLQVELASLLYQQSRLVRSWTHLERQRGGVGLRGGPGESQIEVDRRLIRKRIGKLKKSLAQVVRTRTLQRDARREVPWYTVAFVGYTNAGKSTLFNRLTNATVLAEDKLFATLDPTMRGLSLPGGSKIILSDTVGFIRDLPHQLVAAFRATLEEVGEADLLVIIVDLADPQWSDQLKAVNTVLREMGVEKKPRLTLYNKVDQLDKAQNAGLLERLSTQDDTLFISAVTGEGEEVFLERLEQACALAWSTHTLTVPATEGRIIARFYEEGRVVHRLDEESNTHLTVSLPQAAAGRMKAVLEQFSV